MELLDEIEQNIDTTDGMNINKEIDNMYAYYLLDMLICKINGLDDSDAKRGLLKVKQLQEKYTKQ